VASTALAMASGFDRLSHHKILRLLSVVTEPVEVTKSTTEFTSSAKPNKQ